MNGTRIRTACRMARSRKKTPISGIACRESEKDDKRRWHRAMRRGEGMRLRAGLELQVDERAYSDPWGMAKDGRQYFGDRFPELMRK